MAHRARRCKVMCYSLRKRREDRKDKYEYYQGRYNALYKEIFGSLAEVKKTKKELVQTETELRTLDDARYIDSIKQVMQGHPYGLTEEDAKHLYDDSTRGQHGLTDESLNIQTLRKEKARTDVDGHAVKAVKENGRIYLLGVDGTKTGESYNANDPSILLRDEGGIVQSPGGLAEGKEYNFYDYVYSLEEVTRAMRGNYRDTRETYRDAYRRYADSSAASGKHDRTVMLRDEETMYWDMLDTARKFGAEMGEIRQRSYEGYQTIVTEMVRSDNGGSVQQRIVMGLVAQNEELQEQQWRQQRDTFGERKDRWMETVGFIMNRGMRDWTGSLNGLVNSWWTWRIEARDAIAGGEEAWEEEHARFTGEMNRWRLETSQETAEAAGRMTAEETAKRIHEYMWDMGKRLPCGMSFAVDTETLISDALKNAPPATIGVLAKSMNTVNMTAGFSSLLNLNLSGALAKSYGEQMKEYTKQMSVMQNLRVSDILLGIIDNFNEQLAAANRDVYEGVDTGIRGQYEAPFERHTGVRQWNIRVVTKSNLVGGDKTKTIRIGDYADYTTTAVTLKPLKGLGGVIDFNDPASYMNIDADELDVYVRLESEHLNRQIETIFGQGGGFSTHQEKEYARLGNEFSKAYEKYMMGKALAGSNWYAKSDFAVANAVIGAAAIAFGGPVGMAAYMALQATINANMALDEGGGIGMALNLGSLAASTVVQAYTGGMLSFDLAYTKDGGFGGSVSVGKSIGLNATVGYSKKGGYNVGAGYGFGGGVGFGINYSEKNGFGGQISIPVQGINLGLSYSEKGGIGVHAGASTEHGQMNLGVQLDTHGKFQGYNVGVTAKATAGKFSGSQSVGFGFNRDTGYSLTSGTHMTYGSDWRNMDVGANTNMTINFGRDGSFGGVVCDTTVNASFNNERANSELRKQGDGKLDDEVRREAEQRRDEMNMMEKAGDWLAGAWLSMNNTLGQWGRDVADMVSDFGERAGNWARHGQFTTDDSAVIQRIRDIEVSQTVVQCHGCHGGHKTRKACR